MFREERSPVFQSAHGRIHRGRQRLNRRPPLFRPVKDIVVNRTETSFGRIDACLDTSQPVTLTVSHFTTMMHPMLKKAAIGANASALIKRSDFNAGKYAPNVGDEVTIRVAIEAIKG